MRPATSSQSGIHQEKIKTLVLVILLSTSVSDRVRKESVLLLFPFCDGWIYDYYFQPSHPNTVLLKGWQQPSDTFLFIIISMCPACQYREVSFY